jgi:hypothetical protein
VFRWRHKPGQPTDHNLCHNVHQRLLLRLTLHIKDQCVLPRLTRQARLHQQLVRLKQHILALPRRHAAMRKLKRQLKWQFRQLKKPLLAGRAAMAALDLHQRQPLKSMEELASRNKSMKLQQQFSVERRRNWAEHSETSKIVLFQGSKKISRDSRKLSCALDFSQNDSPTTGKQWQLSGIKFS